MWEQKFHYEYGNVLLIRFNVYIPKVRKVPLTSIKETLFTCTDLVKILNIMNRRQ